MVLALAKELDNDSVTLIQSLLSRMSCKLRLNSQPYVFADSTNSFKCWLEPTSMSEEASNFPVTLAFSRDTPKNAYRSLIKLDNGVSSAKWLGSLHTDCERPVSQWPVKYLFQNTVGSCAEPKNNGYKTTGTLEIGIALLALVESGLLIVHCNASHLQV